MLNVAAVLAREHWTIRDALAELDRSGQGMLLLVDEAGRLKRIVTDGDIRRLLLAGAQLSDTLARLDARAPVTLREGAGEAEAMQLMAQHVIDHVPVIDAEGRPLHVFARRDLDARIYLSAPHLSGHERQFVEEAFRSNWIAPLGPNVDAFEKELAAYTGARHAAALSSGTAALHLALRVLGIGAGDTVFCSTFTFIASAAPIVYERARPVFIDSDFETWNMSPAALEAAFRAHEKAGTRVKAVIVVNLYGQSADIDPIQALCDRYGAVLIEDAAESLGATYKSKASGTLGRVGIYSFNGNKIITTSGGGMLVAEDGDLVERVRYLSTQARQPVPHYEHTEIGYNYRMSNVLAGIGRGQLLVLEERIRQRRQVFEWYRQYLQDIEAIRWMPEASYGRCTRWLSACWLDPQLTDLKPVDIMRALAKENIEARPLWKPMHQQPVFKGEALFTATGTCVSDKLFAQGLCLPSGSDLVESQVRRICEIVRRAFVHH